MSRIPLFLILLLLTTQNTLNSKELYMSDFQKNNRCINKGDFINEMIDQNAIFVGPGYTSGFRKIKIDIFMSTNKENREATILLKLYEVPYRQPEGEPVIGKPIQRVVEKIKIIPGVPYNTSILLNIPENYSQFKEYYDSFTVFFDFRIEQSEKNNFCFDKFNIKGVGIK